MNYFCHRDGVFTPLVELRKVKLLRNQLPHEKENLTDHRELRSAQNI